MIQYVENGDVAVYDGMKFRRDKKTGYFLNAKTHKRLHVYVWEKHFGKVKDGFVVHHIDFDKNNNEIENLALMLREDHASLHGASWDEERQEKQAVILRQKAIPKATEWHKSDNGRAWHRAHYEAMKGSLHKKITRKCEYCGKEYEGANSCTARFCSNNCKSAYRRQSGVDNVTKVCEACGGEYTANKYSKTKYCTDCQRKAGYPRGRIQHGGSRQSQLCS